MIPGEFGFVKTFEVNPEMDLKTKEKHEAARKVFNRLHPSGSFVSAGTNSYANQKTKKWVVWVSILGGHPSSSVIDLYDCFSYVECLGGDFFLNSRYL